MVAVLSGYSPVELLPSRNTVCRVSVHRAPICWGYVFGEVSLELVPGLATVWITYFLDHSSLICCIIGVTDVIFLKSTKNVYYKCISSKILFPIFILHFPMFNLAFEVHTTDYVGTYVKEVKMKTTIGSNLHLRNICTKIFQL